MRYLNLYTLRAQCAVFLGLLSACLYDMSVNRHAGYVALDASAAIFATQVLFLMVALLLIAMLLERYVRPLSRAGALMTGFCGYALISFVAL